jgi:predicted amidohydrolase YtcJ
MLGDAVVLEEDPHAVPDRIADIEVAATVLGGRLVYTAD